MSFQVEIKSKELRNQNEYKGKMYGEQQCALLGYGDYPLPFKVSRQTHEALEPGIYTLDPTSFATDERGNLRLVRVKLLKASK